MSREPEMTATPLTAGAATASLTGPDATRAPHGVLGDLARGELTAITGPPGAGKPTMMHCAAGLDAVTSGEVCIGDVDSARLKDKALTTLRRDRIGFVFQSFNLIPTLNAE